MRKIIALTHISIDGVMQSPGGPDEDPSHGFKLGGWSMHFGDESSNKILGEIMARKFDLLLGRRTYEIFAAYWPYSEENAIANSFNSITKYVATRTLTEFDWQNSQGLKGDAVEAVRKLKASNGPELHIWGSGNLLQSLIAADLIDEYYQFVSPVVLGKGKRLFEAGTPPRALKLIKSQSDSTGLVINLYHPNGEVPKGVPFPGPPSDAEMKRRKKLALEK